MQDVWSEPPCRAVEQGGQLRLVWRTGKQAHVRLSRVTRAVHNSFSVKVVPPALMDATARAERGTIAEAVVRHAPQHR
jgi:hypothetical protein